LDYLAGFYGLTYERVSHLLGFICFFFGFGLAVKKYLNASKVGANYLDVIFD
jgi:hypothetical protein